MFNAEQFFEDHIRVLILAQVRDLDSIAYHDVLSTIEEWAKEERQAASESAAE